MRRRDLFKAAGASLAGLVAPRIGRAKKSSKLVFVPTEDLGALDQFVASIRATRRTELPAWRLAAPVRIGRNVPIGAGAIILSGG